MDTVLGFLEDLARGFYAQAPGGTWLFGISMVLLFLSILFWAAVYVCAPIPRPPYASETTYKTVGPDGQVTEPLRLPCWQDKWLAGGTEVEKAEVFMSVVVPAFNEQDRLGEMLEEAIAFLEREYTSTAVAKDTQGTNARQRRTGPAEQNGSVSTTSSPSSSSPQTKGWEILLVSDGSTDNTTSVALDFAEKHPHGSIRVIKLVRNRGKGGAVTHGMRHARGSYVVFADADGASKFSDLRKLVDAAEKSRDAQGRVVAVGSRAHLVGSDAVVKRSRLRNFLMHSFHLLLRLLTPPATSRIKDTQCGFKLFSREALPEIVPHMHSEGWIFDVEMLMLAERAGMPMVEVQVGWHEVKGSKLNVLWDSLGMAWGLTILRLAWAMGVYQTERVT